MQDTTYNIADCNTVTLHDDVNNHLEYSYILIGDYKIVTVNYVRKNNAYAYPPNDTPILVGYEIPPNFRPNTTLFVQTTNKNIQVYLKSDGSFTIRNTSSSSVNFAPYGSFTYIVPNRNI